MESVLGARRLRAWLIVGAASIAIVMICLFSGTVPALGKQGLHGIGTAWDELRDGATEQEAIAACGVSLSDRPPDWFMDEIPCDGLEISYADVDWNLVRMDAPCAPEQMESRLGRQLEDVGWLKIESECEGIGTFAKKEGKCTWLMVESAETADGTSAVLHILHD